MTVLGEVAPYVASAATAAAGWLVGRRGRRATAARDEADALDTLTGTVQQLGEQLQALHARLAGAEAESARLRSELAAAEAEIGRLRSELAAAKTKITELRTEMAKLKAGQARGANA